MDASWEGEFSGDGLRRGRNLYKRGSIKEVSLSDEDAIVTCKIGKVENYSVVEWEEDRLNIRSSTQDRIFAEAIAVAGLLEIEEMIADEDLFLLQEGKPGEEEEAAHAVAEDADVGEEEGEEASRSSRMLHLVLDTHFKGLICEAFWLSDDGALAPALVAGDGAPRAETPDERGRLITLAARARKSHFTYSSEFNGYLLENLNEIPFFINNVWPAWKKTFSTAEKPNVSRIKEGFAELKLGAQARLTAKGKLAVDWVVDSGRRLLSDELARQLMERDSAGALIPELGLVRLSSGSREALGRWEEMSSGEERHEFEPYQLFSLFPEQNGAVVLDQKLGRWREALFAPGEGEEEKWLGCLRPYQREGVKWMDRLLRNGCHCLLADEMGLGKTVQVIAQLERRLEPGQQALIVCPASVVPVWISEFAKFAPQRRVIRYEGRSLEKLGADWEILVCSYAQARSRIESLAGKRFAFAALDEAQFIKNPDAKVTQSCMRLRADRRVALTGTPIENRPLDIWPVFRFLMPGLLGSRKSFESQLQENPGAFKKRLRAQIGPFMLRRTKRDVAKELPEKIIIDQPCAISRLQAAEYGRICTAGIQRLGNDLGSALRNNRFAALSLLTRLRQASCDPHLLPWVEAELEDSGKLMMLLEKLIEVLGTGHKVVIFSQFTRFLRRIRAMIEVSFPDLPIFELTGSTKDRQEPVEGFQSCDQTAAMLVSLRAAGTGITLHSAEYVFLMDPWWNPAVENQAIDRVHRIGQTNTVFVYRFIAEGTIEERIQDLQREKSELFKSLVEDSSAGADELARQFKSLEALLVLAGAKGRG